MLTRPCPKYGYAYDSIAVFTKPESSAHTLRLLSHVPQLLNTGARLKLIATILPETVEQEHFASQRHQPRHWPVSLI